MSSTPEESGVDEGRVPTGVELTALDPTFQADPHPVLDRLRAAEPVHYDEQLNRYVLTRHEEIDRLLHDRSLSVDPRKAAPGTFEANFILTERDREPSMLLSDPPYHTRLRALVSKAFTAKAVEQLQAADRGDRGRASRRDGGIRRSRPDHGVCGAAADDRDCGDAGRGPGGPGETSSAGRTWG